MWEESLYYVQMEKGEDKDRVEVSCISGNSDKLLLEVKLVYRDHSCRRKLRIFLFNQVHVSCALR